MHNDRDQIYEDETVYMVAIPKEYTAGLKASGFNADLKDFTEKIRGWKTPGKRVAEHWSDEGVVLSF